MSENKIAANGKPVDLPKPSLALYVSGMVVVLCGVQAVNLTIGIPTFSAVSIALTILGFVFAYGSRVLGLNIPVVQFLCVSFVLFVLYTTIGSEITPFALFQPDSDRNDFEMAIILACAGVVWSWLVVTDDLVAFSCVLTLAMLGLVGSQNINEPIIVDFCIMVLFAVFLIIHHNYLQNKAVASDAEKMRPMIESVRVQFIIAVLCSACVLGLAMVVIVPAQIVFSRMSLMQAMNKIESMGTPGHSLIPPGGLQFSDDDTMPLGTGQGLDQSTDVLMHITPSDGLPHYLLGRTYDEYNGDGWRSTLTDEDANIVESDQDGNRDFPLPTPNDGSQFKNPGVLNTNIHADVVVSGYTTQIYYVGQPYLLQLDAKQYGSPDFSPDGALDLGGTTITTTYTVNAHVPPDPRDPAVQEGLRRSGTNYPPIVRRLYMGPVSNDMTLESDRAFFRDAVQQAEAGLSPEQQDPYDIAEAIRAWVANRCVYSLTVAPIDPSLDHVHVFLASTRKGYCDMFASSMAVLCRTAGLPSRLATGFDPGTETPNGGFDIAGTDKHAWVQVYFPGYGWIDFDPTIGTKTDGSVAVARQNRINWVYLIGMLPTKPLPVTLTLLLLGIGGYLIKVEAIDNFLLRRRLRTRLRFSRGGEGDWAATEVRIAVVQRHQSALQSVSRIVGKRLAQETPTEYVNRVVPKLDELEREWNLHGASSLLERLTEDFLLARYGDSSDLQEDPAAELDRQVETLRRRAAVIQWMLLFRRMFRISRRESVLKPSTV